MPYSQEECEKRLLVLNATSKENDQNHKEGTALGNDLIMPNETGEKKDDNNEEDIIDNGPAPDGGLKAYLVLGAAATIMAMSFGMCNSFGVYQSYYEEKYPDVSSNVLSIIGSLQSALTFCMAVPSTIGMYYVGQQMMVLTGGLMACLGYMFLSITKEVWQVFLAQGALFGIGSGVMYVHSTGVTFQYFEKKKALAQGLITAGASLGGVYWPIGVENLINKVGFNWANRIIGFIYIPMFIFAATFLRPRYKPSNRKPGENFLRIKFVVLKDWEFWMVGIAWFLFMMSLFPGMFYIDLFCIRAGVESKFQNYSVAIINACALIFRVFPGFVGDKVGRINITIPALVLSGIFPLALWIPARGTGLTVTFVVLWSCATGLPVALFPTIVGQLFNGPNIYSYLSFFFIFSGTGCLIGPIIGGTFIPPGSESGSIQGFDKLAIFCGVLSLASAFILTIVRCLHTRKLLYKI